MDPGKVCKLATACAILHNIAILLGEEDVDCDDDQEQDDNMVPYNGNRQDGQAVRDHIVNTYF